MNVYKIYNDWEDFLIVAENIEDALMLGSEKFDMLIENEKASELANNKELYDKQVAAGSEISDWLKKALAGADDVYADYEIHKISKVGVLPEDDDDE